MISDLIKLNCDLMDILEVLSSLEDNQYFVSSNNNDLFAYNIMLTWTLTLCPLG